MVLRIIFDHVIFSQQVYGGISRYFYELSKELSAASGVSTEILAPLYVNKYINIVDNKIVGLKIAGYLPKPVRLSLLVNGLIAPLVLKIKQPDIIHETYYSEGSKLRLGCKNILTVYDMIHELYPDSFPKSDRTSELKKISVDRADHIICISENTRNDLIKLFGVPKEKTTVIYLGFKLKDIKESDLLTFDIDGPYLLYVGNRGGYKNFSTFLKAFSLSRVIDNDCKLVCFGGGAFTHSERAEIDACGINSNSIIQVSGDDALLAALYSKAKLFVYPSLYEGFGIPPLEAMNYGCPVICSNSSSLPEVVGEAAELFEPTSVDSLVVAIEKVFYSSEYASNLVEQGYQQVKKFSWERCAKETLDLYKAQML